MDKEVKTKIETLTYINGTLVSGESDEKKLQLFTLASDLMNEIMLNNMGIGLIHLGYIETNESQDKAKEYKKILNFLNRYLEYYAKSNDIPLSDLNLEFINYGKTELVYVLTRKDGEKLTLLVKQPAVRLGDVSQEMQYLLDLKEKDGNVVAPIDYFQIEDQELYVTPYINQARCVASDFSWGMYIPEPYYRFEPFTPKQEKIVNTCMIAKLVSLYDFDKQEGISCCKLGGGDFMLPKGWEKEEPTIENTLSQIYLIAARNKIKCSFEEYLQIIRDEFSRVTINEEQSNLIVNLRGRVPMQITDIEDGIVLGRTIIASRSECSHVKSLIKNRDKKA